VPGVLRLWRGGSVWPRGHGIRRTPAGLRRVGATRLRR